MKFHQWCAEDPRRLPHCAAAQDQPTHLWFGSNWQDGDHERWTVRWAPRTGELYAYNGDWDVRPIGHIPTAGLCHEAYTGVRILQSVPDSLRLLTQIIDEAAAVWGPGLDPEPEPRLAGELGIDL